MTKNTLPPASQRAAAAGRAAEPSINSPFASLVAICGLLALTLPLFFFRLGSWPFFDPDEGRYAEIPREMLKSHDWVTPHLSGVLYFEKPPLLYWSVAGLFHTFGLHEWVGRLVPALAGLAGVFLVYGLGRRMFGARAGWLGGIVCATSLLWCIMARELVIDTLFSTALFAALALWWLGHSDTDEGRADGYFLACWVALAAAVLAKGPVAVVLVGAILFVYAFCCAQLRSLFALRAWRGLPLFLLITAPWFIVVAQRNPGFNHFFWYGQHIGRYLGIGANREHVQAFSYFFYLWPALFFPWSLFVPGAVFAHRAVLWPVRPGSAATPRRRAALYCILAAFGITLFFSASTSKLVPYVLPALPPLALLMGAYFDRLLTAGQAAWRGPLWLGVGMLLLGTAALAIGAVVAGPHQLQRLEALGTTWIVALASILIAWFAAIALAAQRRSVAGLVAATAGGFALLFCQVQSLVAAAAPNHTTRLLIDAIRPGLAAGGEIVQYDVYTPSIDFYTNSLSILVGNTGELSYGVSQLTAAQRQRRYPADLRALQVIMAQPKPVYCLVADHERARVLLAQLGPGNCEIMWNKRRAVVGNRRAAALTPPQPPPVPEPARE